MCAAAHAPSGAAGFGPQAKHRPHSRISRRLRLAGRWRSSCPKGRQFRFSGNRPPALPARSCGAPAATAASTWRAWWAGAWWRCAAGASTSCWSCPTSACACTSCCSAATASTSARAGRAAPVSLGFDGGELNFYACSVRFIEEPLDLVYDWWADVMSPHWDPVPRASAARHARHAGLRRAAGPGHVRRRRQHHQERGAVPHPRASAVHRRRAARAQAARTGGRGAAVQL
jgi:hypothetical protein